MQQKIGGLVLSRQQGEAVRIDGPCKVMVKKLSRGRVVLRFVCDRSVRVVRDELKDGGNVECGSLLLDGDAA